MLFPKNIGSAVDAIDDDVHIYDCYDTASVLCCDSDLFATLFFPTRYGLKQLESTADFKGKNFSCMQYFLLQISPPSRKEERRER